MTNISIFASGSGTNAENIIQYFSNSKLAKVVLVLSDRKDAFVLHRAQRMNVPYTVFDHYHPDWKNVTSVLDSYHTDIIILAGFLLKIPSSIIELYPQRIINIHPALIPKYCGKGMYGEKVHEAVIAAREKESGITIHLVDSLYDHGDILFNATCTITPDDTPETLAAKIHILEQKYFPKVIDDYIQNLL